MRLRALLIPTVFLLGAFFSPQPASQAQNSSKASRSTLQNDTLARPIDWGKFPSRLFKNSDVKISFSLRTSWIPGEGHKGVFRYTVKAAVDYPPLSQQAKNPEYSSEMIETLLKRTHECSIYLKLQDVDGFKLRSILIPFSYGVDNDALVKGLYANDSAQMDASEYRQFVGSSNASGSWSISWDCGENP